MYKIMSLAALVVLLALAPQSYATVQDGTMLSQFLSGCATVPPGLSGWRTGEDPCTARWVGVTCNSGTGTGNSSTPATVVGLKLQGMGLACNLTRLAGMTSLTELSLDNNQFVGTISNDLRTLVRLQTLTLSNNKFSGTVPAWIGNVAQLGLLRSLDLSFNTFVGLIPSTLGNNSLVRLALNNNQLGGYIPASFALFPNNATINLNGNLLSGNPAVYTTAPVNFTVDFRCNNFRTLPTWCTNTSCATCAQVATCTVPPVNFSGASSMAPLFALATFMLAVLMNAC